MQLEQFREHRRRKKRPIQRAMARANNPVSVVGGTATVGASGASQSGVSSAPAQSHAAAYYVNYNPWWGYPWAYWGWPMGYGFAPYYQPYPPFPQTYAAWPYTYAYAPYSYSYAPSYYAVRAAA